MKHPTRDGAAGSANSANTRAARRPRSASGSLKMNAAGTRNRPGSPHARPRRSPKTRHATKPNGSTT